MQRQCVLVMRFALPCLLLSVLLLDTIPINAAVIVYTGDAQYSLQEPGTLLLERDSSTSLVFDRYRHPNSQSQPPASINLRADGPKGTFAQLDIRHQLFADNRFEVSVDALGSGFRGTDSQEQDIGAFYLLDLLYFIDFRVESASTERILLHYAFDTQATGVFERDLDSPGRGLTLLKGSVIAPPFSFNSLLQIQLGANATGSILVEPNLTYSLVLNLNHIPGSRLEETFGPTNGTMSLSAILGVEPIPEPASWLLLATGLLLIRRRHHLWGSVTPISPSGFKLVVSNQAPSVGALHQLPLREKITPDSANDL